MASNETWNDALQYVNSSIGYTFFSFKLIFLDRFVQVLNLISQVKRLSH